MRLPKWPLRVFILASAFTLPVTLQAAGFDLLRIDATPRGAAMGGFPVAMSGSRVGALEINPAGLASLSGQMVSVTYGDHPLDLASGRAAYARPMAGGMAAVSVNWFTYGQFERRASLDVPSDGSFGANDLLLTAGWGREWLTGLSLGGAVKLLHSRIDTYSSTAAAVDVGAQYAIPAQRARVAVEVANLGVQFDPFAETRENLPLVVRVGGARRLEHLPLELTATVHAESDGTVFATGAGEFTVSDQLVLRGGYTTLASDLKVSGPDDSLAGLSAGIGLIQGRLRLDYAFHSDGALGQVHRISAGMILP